MADQVHQGDVSTTEVDDDNPNYQAPPEKTLQEIINADNEDESLRKYKEALLGSALTTDAIIVFEKDPRKVIVRSLALLVEGRPDLVLDLSGILQLAACFIIQLLIVLL